MGNAVGTSAQDPEMEQRKRKRYRKSRKNKQQQKYVNTEMQIWEVSLLKV